MRATLALNGWRKRENFFNQKKIFGRWKMYLKATNFMFRSDFSMQWVRTKFTPKLFSRNKFWFLNVASSFPLRKLQSARYTFYIKRKLKTLWANCYCCLSSCYFIWNVWIDIATEAYLEPLQRHMIELFCKKNLNSFWPLTTFARKDFL